MEKENLDNGIKPDVNESLPLRGLLELLALHIKKNLKKKR